MRYENERGGILDWSIPSHSALDCFNVPLAPGRVWIARNKLVPFAVAQCRTRRQNMVITSNRMGG